MLIAYLILFRRLPSLVEFVAIVVHDWGYWGCEGIDSQGGERHPYLGARICRRLFGEEGWRLAIGHNDDTARAEQVPLSTIYRVDKYFYVLIPVWLHRLLGFLSGEYREIEADPNRGWDPRRFKETMRTRFCNGDLAQVR
jgi:hypothetical protein